MVSQLQQGEIWGGMFVLLRVVVACEQEEVGQSKQVAEHVGHSLPTRLIGQEGGGQHC